MIQWSKSLSPQPNRHVECLVTGGKLKPGSRIGFITSEGGSIGLRTEKEGGGNYGHHGSKAAQNMMCKMLAYDLKPHEISVVMIHPGFLRTSMTGEKTLFASNAILWDPFLFHQLS